MPADNSKENSPVNKVEQKLAQYFESRRKALKAPDDLWSRIETRLEPPKRKAEIVRPHGIAWIFRQWRLAGVAAAVLALLVVSATMLTVTRRPENGVMSPPLAPEQIASPSLAPMAGAAPRGFEPDKGIRDEQARGDTVPPTAVTPLPAEPRAIPAPAVQAAPGGSPGPAGPRTKAGAEARVATPAPAAKDKPVTPRPQAAAPPRATVATPEPAPLADPRRQIISTATVSIEVKAVAQALEELRVLVESLGGFIGQLSRSERPEQQQATVTVRVPQEQFSTALSRLESLGKIQDQASKSEDVTERFIDLEARLKALERQEQSLLALLAKTQSISEVLTIERELARTRGEIERIQGQLNSMKRQVEMATITVNLFTPPAKPSPPPSASLSMEVAQVDRSIDTVKTLVAVSKGAVDQVTISLTCSFR